MSTLRRLAVLFVVAFVAAGPALAQGQDSATLTLERIFASREFSSERFGPARWMADGQTFTTLEPSADVKDARDLVLYTAATGERKVLVSAAKLTPPGASAPLSIDDYGWSPDGQVLIVFTNTKRVWRQNTRGDYWTYDLRSSRLGKLGARFEPSTLMFAKLAPDGRLAAYVMKNNLYVEDLQAGSVRQLTKDGSEDIVNGTSDWVYEEEFDLRDGFRWSPDRRAISFLRFDTRWVPVFTMINNTDGTYPTLTQFKYPKAGEANSAVQVGVVKVSGGDTVWIKAAGDPRQIYIPRLEWAGNSNEIVFQQLNRLQNTNQVVIGNAATGEVRTVFTDRDEAWVEVMEFTWLAGGKSLLWLSERDGWKHAYSVPRDGGDARLLTPGDYDVLGVNAVDEKGGWLYVTASPEAPTKRFVYRVPLDGKGKPERLGAAAQTGVHRYDISPSTKWAFHNYS